MPTISEVSRKQESTEYIRLLERWYPTAEKWMHVVQGGPELAYYGTGGHQHWAVQANCTAFAALAVLATAPELHEEHIACSRETVHARALQMLRYIIRTHKSGDLSCVSGQPWGHSWISGLGFERCAHGITALRPWLNADDQHRLRALMISESDFLLAGYPVVGAIANNTGQNKPESNIWNGALLYRTAMLFPDAPNVARYREKSTALLLNGISMPTDADADTSYSGKALRDWHVGPNYTRHYGLNHHGYMNLGYMVICLSQVAMLHYFCQENGIAAPPELYHHAADLWQLVKSLTFDDGRLWRIGGDTRVRYCYCQDYAVPVWQLAGDLWHDADAEKFAAGWRTLVESEQACNADGGFLSGRLASLAEVSPLYYCRLEGDRAASLSMGAYWSRQQPVEKQHTPVRALTAWHDDFHGAAMVRGKRLASWVWKAAQLPCGTVVPADRSDLVEWQWNLAGRIVGAGCMVKAEVERARIDRFDGGFVSCGNYYWHAIHDPAEGVDDERLALARTTFAVLPDDATVIILQHAQASNPVYLTEAAGLFLNVPNDLYNGSKRTYCIDGEDQSIVGAGGAKTPIAETIDCGNRLGIDGRMSVQVLYGGALALRRPGKRLVNLCNNVPLWFSGAGANLYCDTICLPYVNTQTFYEKDAVIYDLGAVITVDGDSQAACLSQPETAVRLVEVVGKDDRRYLLATNITEDAARVTLPSFALNAEVLVGARPIAMADGVEVDIAPGAAMLLRVQK